jgi:hypothetical protein
MDLWVQSLSKSNSKTKSKITKQNNNFIITTLLFAFESIIIIKIIFF